MPEILSPLRLGKPWMEVKHRLLYLTKMIMNGRELPSIAFRDTVQFFHPLEIVQRSNFKMLDKLEIGEELKRTVSLISNFAQKIDALLSHPIPTLKCIDRSGKIRIYVTRELCCSLLANAFFCTFPENRNDQMSDFNFFRLYNDTQTARCEVKIQKLKCFLSYFQQMHDRKDDTAFLNQIVSFERRKISSAINWETIEFPLLPVQVELNLRIEEQQNMLQADFANKFIGGGVLNDGSVMEEIRFCISPELLVAKLFSPVLEDTEAVTITGTEIFSKYSGYSTSFRYEGAAVIRTLQTDSLGRTTTKVVAMDATSFTR